MNENFLEDKMDEWLEPESIVKKGSSEGEEWVKSRQEKQLENETQRTGTGQSISIFGHDLLSNWETMHMQGKYWKFIEKSTGSDKRLLRSFQQNAEKQHASKLNFFQKDLVSLATRDPSAFGGLIFHYLKGKSIKDIKSIGEEIGYDKKNNAEYFLRKMFLLTEEEKKFLTIDMVKTMRSKYASGDMVLKEDILIPMLEHHNKEVVKIEAEIQKELLEFKEKIKLLLIIEIQEKKLPLSKQFVEERIDTLKFKVIDNIISRLDEKWGDFDSNSHTIRFSSDVPKDQLWDVFVHEVFHALSGQIENKLFSEGYEDESVNRQLKIGARFSPSDWFPGDNNSKSINMRWLNEALTEQATLDLVEKNDSYAYKEERKLLQKLIESGISKNMLYEYYFENYDTTKEKGEHRLPKTKELFKFTNEKFGAGFLVNLDRFISYMNKKEKKLGVVLAMKEWDTQKDNFPEFLKNWQSSREKDLLG